MGSESLSKAGYPEGFRSFQNSFKKLPKMATNYINSLSFDSVYNSLLINLFLFCAQSKLLTALSSKAKTIFKLFC